MTLFLVATATTAEMAARVLLGGQRIRDGCDNYIRGTPVHAGQIVVCRGEAKLGNGQGATRPPVRKGGKVPLDRLGARPAVKTVAQVDEGLHGGDVDVVDGGAVQHDGAEQGQVRVAGAGRPVVVPEAVGFLGVPLGRRASRVRRDVCEEPVCVLPRVGIVEAFAEAVDENTWVGGFDIDGRVARVVAVEGEKGVAGVGGVCRGYLALFTVAACMRGRKIAIFLVVGVGDRVDCDFSQEAALGAGKADQEQHGRQGGGGVD